jgi:hypothetical protein
MHRYEQIERILQLNLLNKAIAKQRIHMKCCKTMFQHNRLSDPSTEIKRLYSPLNDDELKAVPRYDVGLGRWSVRILPLALEMTFGLNIWEALGLQGCRSGFASSNNSSIRQTSNSGQFTTRAST